MKALQNFVAVPQVVRWLLVVVVLLSSQQALAEAPVRVVSIHEARALPLGSVVTVEGAVSTPSGAFASSFFDQGFGLQDLTAGLYVSLQTELGLQTHQRVRVTGVLQESYGLLVLLPEGAEDVQARGFGFGPWPRPVSTSSIGEATEGSLVTVIGKVTQAVTSDLPYGYKLRLDDGSGEAQVFVNLQTGIDVSTLALGQKLLVVGFSSQFDDHYEIDPRSPRDVLVLRR